MNNALMVEISPGELIDKITILEIKMEKITDELRLSNVRVELKSLLQAKKSYLQDLSKVSELIAKLKEINQNLWEIEDDLRQFERMKEFGPRFIALARSVYKKNDLRAQLKRQINEALGSNLKEEKSYANY